MRERCVAHVKVKQQTNSDRLKGAWSNFYVFFKTFNYSTKSMTLQGMKNSICKYHDCSRLSMTMGTLTMRVITCSFQIHAVRMVDKCW